MDLTRRHVVFVKTKNGEARGSPLHQRVVEALTNLPHRVGEVFRRPDGLPHERPKHPDDTSAGSRAKQIFAFPASVGEFAGSQVDVCLAPVLSLRAAVARLAETCSIRVVANREAHYERSGIKPAPIQENPDVRGSYPDRRGVT